jgi:predicted aspartyl protease
MKNINSSKEPTLLGVIENSEDIFRVSKMVDNINQDLIDSGFDQYQFITVQRGKKLYIERSEGP